MCVLSEDSSHRSKVYLISFQMCGMFLLEDNKSLVEMLVGMGKDRMATEEALAW